MTCPRLRRCVLLAAFAAFVAASVVTAAIPAGAASRVRWRTFPARRIAGPQGLEGDTFVARTQEEWDAAWRGEGRGAEPPRVNFRRSMVVGVHSGGSSGCQGFRLLALCVSRRGAEFLWQPTQARDELCTMNVWDEWRYAVVPRTRAEVTFRKLRTYVYGPRH